MLYEMSSWAYISGSIYRIPSIPQAKVSPRGSFLWFAHADPFHVPVPSSMQEKVQLEGTTGKLGKSAWLLPWPIYKIPCQMLE